MGSALHPGLIGPKHARADALGVPGAFSQVLNVMQYTLVALASGSLRSILLLLLLDRFCAACFLEGKESFKRIKRELAEYLCRRDNSTISFVSSCPCVPA